MSEQKHSPCFVIAISGTSGAGKTTLTRRVASLLNDAIVLHFDDYQSVATYPTYMRQWIETKNLDAWEIPQLTADLQALRRGESIMLPAGKGSVGPAKYVVLEEPAGRARTELSDLINFEVFLDLPLDLALARKVVEYFDFCVREVPLDELMHAIQVGIDYYAQYPIHREYYLTLVARGSQDCDLLLDGTRSVDQLAHEIVAIIKSLAE